MLLNRQLERIFTAGKKITSDMVKSVREQAAGMEIDFAKNLGITPERLERMLQVSERSELALMKTSITHY